MSSPSLVIVLAEDQRQKQFIYRYLVNAGIGPRQMTIEMSPSGQGSAEHWVRKNFPREARKCRARNARASTVLFVLLDADRRTVRERLDELDRALEAAGQNPIDPDQDPIARLIPKRNIETWILYLSATGSGSPSVNEEQDYKQTKIPEEWSALIPAASGTLFGWTRSAALLPGGLIDSLRHGIQEILRVFPLGR